MTRRIFDTLARQSARRYRSGGRFAQGFAYGKLTRDPVFAYLLGQGLLNPPDSPATRNGSGQSVDPQQASGPTQGDGTIRSVPPKVLSEPAPLLLDLGCGQGVVAAMLTQARHLHAHGLWPDEWPVPVRSDFHGIELMPRDVARAHAALGDTARFVTGDIALTPYPRAHTVLILDVLHYLPYDAQDRVLAAVRAALIPGGRLLLRVGDADGGFGFRWSNWVDHVVTWFRGHRLPRLYCRAVRQWCDVLHGHGFEIEQRPMSEGTLFANVLLIGRLADGPTEAIR